MGRDGIRRSWVGRRYCCSEPTEAFSRRDGTPIALGYHTGHGEVGLLMQASGRVKEGRRGALRRIRNRTCEWAHARNHRACSTSLAYRNEGRSCFAASSLYAHAASVIGVATCA